MPPLPRMSLLPSWIKKKKKRLTLLVFFSLTGTIKCRNDLWCWKTKLMSRKTVNHVTQLKATVDISNSPVDSSRWESVTMAVIQLVRLLPCYPITLSVSHICILELMGVYTAYEWSPVFWFAIFFFPVWRNLCPAANNMPRGAHSANIVFTPTVEYATGIMHVNCDIYPN